MMNDAFILFLIVALVAGLLYYGYIFVVQKTLHPSSTPADQQDYTKAVKKQSQKAEQTWDQQRRMMETQQDRLRDLQRR